MKSLHHALQRNILNLFVLILGIFFILGSDGTPPEITIIGDNPVTIAQGETYKDAGATANDNINGNVKVTTTGLSLVDTSTIGKYTITYTAIDLDKNKSTATRVVNVIASADTEAPVITISGDNPVDVLQGSTYSDAGATATDNIDTTVTVQTSGTVDTAVIGVYEIKYTAKDSAGNNAIAKTRTVNVIAPQKTLAPTPPEVVNTIASITVRDAEGNNVEGAKVTVIEDKDDLIKEDEESQVSEEELGVVNYALNDFEGTKKFTVNIEKEGFFSNSRELEATAGESSDANIIVITSDTTEVKSITVEKETVADINDQPLKVVVKPTTGSAEELKKPTVTIEIPQSTIMRDKDGKALTGKVEAKVAQFDPNSEEALAAFPGGFAANITNPEAVNAAPNSQSSDGEETKGEVIFQSAGFTAVEINVGGEKVEKFDTPINISMRIPKGTLNPKTKKKVAVGDIVPIWSYDAAKDKWSYEGEGTVVNNNNGTPADFSDDYLEVPYTATHLSYWNLDWYNGGRCSRAKLLVKSSLEGNPNDKRRLRTTIEQSGYTKRGNYRGDGFITVRRFPRGDVQLSFYDRASRSKVRILSVDGNPFDATKGLDLCGATPDASGTPTITLILEDTSIKVTANATVETYCSNTEDQSTTPINRAYISAHLFSNNRYIKRLGYKRSDKNGEVSFDFKIPKTTLDSNTLSVRFYGWARVDRRWKRIRTIVPLDSQNLSASIRFPQICTIPNNLPIAIITETAITMNEGDEKTIVGKGSDVESGVLTYKWSGYNWRNSVITNQPEIALKSLPTSITPYTLILTVTDSQGGKGTDSVQVTVNPTPNQAPIANAGDDFTITEGEGATLHGKGSDAEDGDLTDASVFSWKKEGTNTEYAGTDPVIGFLDLPYSETANQHTFNLTVIDSKAKPSEATTLSKVVVTVQKNEPPVVNANADNVDYTAIIQGQKITLKGSATDDQGSDASNLSYQWRDAADNALGSGFETEFDTAGLALGEYDFTLNVSDTLGKTGSASVKVQIIANKAPVVDANSDNMDYSSIIQGQKITLKGSATDDQGSDTSNLSYEWKDAAGNLIGNGAEMILDTAKFAVGEQDFVLYATDKLGKTGGAAVKVNIIANNAPVADAGANMGSILGLEVILDGSGSSSDDGNGTLSYQWDEVTVTDTLVANGFSGTGKTLTTKTLPIGRHYLRLTVTDEFGATGTDKVVVVIIPSVDIQLSGFGCVEETILGQKRYVFLAGTIKHNAVRVDGKITGSGSGIGTFKESCDLNANVLQDNVPLSGTYQLSNINIDETDITARAKLELTIAFIKKASAELDIKVNIDSGLVTFSVISYSSE